MEFSIIIPVYNESANINPLYERLRGVMEGFQSKNFEMIFVNDGSSDDSLALIEKLIESDDRVKFLDLSKNFGQQVALSAGLDYAAGEKIIIIDADLQDPPELIPELVQKVDEGYDVVYAKRKNRKGESFFKKWTASVFYRVFSRLVTIDMPLDAGDFRVISRRVAEALRQMPEQQKFLRGQIAWIGFSQTYVEYDRNERNAGETGYTLKKMFRLAMDGITSFSDFPLRLVTMLGFLVSFVAFLVMIYTLYSKFILKDFVQGWASLMISILFLGGVQLIAIGILGEYISRLNQNTRNRPLYIVRQTNMKKAE